MNGIERQLVIECLLEIQSHTCNRNGCNVRNHFSKLELDRIIPDAKGGKYTTGNVNLLCRKCNAKKSDNDTSMDYFKMNPNTLHWQLNRYLNFMGYRILGGQLKDGINYPISDS